MKTNSLTWSFPTRLGRNSFEPLVDEMSDPWQHLSLAQRTPHPALSHVAIDHSAAFAFKMGERLGPEIVRWREEILCEVQALKEELNNDTLAWFQTLPTHGKTAYANRMFPNVPLLRKLGHLIGFPDTDQLMDDLSTGFLLVWKTHTWSLLG